MCCYVIVEFIIVDVRCLDFIVTLFSFIPLCVAIISTLLELLLIQKVY